MDTALTLVDKLAENGSLSFREWVTLIDAQSEKLSLYVFEKARELQQAYYDNKIFIRGLIEFTNYCRNDCFYCGIRKSNQALRRYRLTKEEILLCCQNGYEHGFRSFVLQGGEDDYYTDARMIDIIALI
ncbi:MAG: [FeFe] hydrogenase H-cluster radical SAM maturase HydE, partial [Lachnospiraceae bacterium]|nr:[FeFe] hydrogenase H-cluster radical SAM maturase HydE [Lachnospiraceae bacterium]